MRFTDYIAQDRMPAQAVQVRGSHQNTPVLVLATHAPTPGVTYAPIDDLVVSIVISSHHCDVIRDVGSGREAFRLHRGCVDILPPRTPSYWNYEGTPEVLHISIPESFWRSFMSGYEADIPTVLKRLARTPIYDPLIGELASRVWRYLGSPSSVAETVAHRLITAMMTILVVEHDHVGFLPRRECRTPTLASWRLRRALEIMSTCLERRVSIRQVADDVGLSYSHFQRAFNASTGRTPLQYMTEMRMEYAKDLLQDENRRIIDVAFQLDYSSPGHFSYRFKQIVGMSPKEWRKTLL
jgi:AraC-like DNA-binding protein